MIMVIGISSSDSDNDNHLGGLGGIKGRLPRETPLVFL